MPLIQQLFGIDSTPLFIPDYDEIIIGLASGQGFAYRLTASFLFEDNTDPASDPAESGDEAQRMADTTFSTYRGNAGTPIYTTGLGCSFGGTTERYSLGHTGEGYTPSSSAGMFGAYCRLDTGTTGTRAPIGTRVTSSNQCVIFVTPTAISGNVGSAAPSYTFDMRSASVYHSIICTYQSGGNVDIYFDGILRNSVSIAGTVSTGQKNLGCRHNPGVSFDNFWSGHIKAAMEANVYINPTQALNLHNFWDLGGLEE